MSDGVSEFLSALRPVVRSLGGTVVPTRHVQPGDEPVLWKGEVVAGVRPPELHDALERFVETIERDAGVRLSEMSRAQKQVAVRRLDEHGAFLLRGAVDDVAMWMGVSKVTLYSYLNAIGPPGAQRNQS
jgi:hypothetical protein